MASYLGKISAIVSANTAGYVRGLNEAATQTRAFAQTVQNDISRASREADRSLKSILTPLQQFQRSLNAAVSERLAFKGVDGIVTGIGQLQTKLRELQRQGSRTVDVALNISGRATVDQLIEDLDVLDNRKVQAVIEAVNTESINRAKAQLEQLYSVANEIAKPLSAAARQFEQLGLSVQASFIPALNIAQIAVQELEAKIREGGRVSQDEFDRVAKVVDRTTSAIRRLAQVSSSVGGLASGTELEFTDPLLRQRLAAANQASRRAIGSSAETIAGNPQIASLTTQLRNAAEFAQTLQANLERARLGGLQQDIEAAERRLSRASETVSRITRELNAATAAPAIEAASRRLTVLTDSDLAEEQRRISQQQRAAFASQFLQVDQRESDLINNTGLATDVRDRVRLLAQVEQREREFAQARAESAARAEFASQFLVVDQRESDLINNTGLATDVRERVRLLAEAEQREREFVEARADNARRAEAAGRFLVVDQRESDLLSNRGRATPISQGFLQDRAERTARQEIGAGVDPAIRQFRQLASQVQSVRSQIDSLPATIGSEFVPRLREAEQAFVRLRTSGRATAEEIENASNEVQQLAAQVRRVSQAQGIGSFADGLDDTALRGALGNLQALQQILNRVGATAGSDGARQFDRLRAAIQRATRDGTVGSEAFQRELRQITQDAAAAAAATGRIGQSAAFREIQRGGDIARGGFDKLSLATQQAAFAIDDFFSATGDFTQKIRAVQNNVTQLAFILGGTTGLFIGLGVAIAAQAAVALFKWANGTVDAEDKTKALNDALARQKSLVEELKQAFDSLGDSLTRGIFDEATERARNLESQIKSVTDAAQRQIEFAASLDSGVQGERARQADLQSRLDQSSDGTERAILQRQIELSRQAEQRGVDRVREEVGQVDFASVLYRLAEGIDSVTQARVADLVVSQFGDRARFRRESPQVADEFRRGGLELSQISTALFDTAAELGDDLLAARDVLRDRVNAVDENLTQLQGQSLFATDFNPFANAISGEREALRREAEELGLLLAQVSQAIARGNVKLIEESARVADGIGGSLRRSLAVIESTLDGFGPLASEQRRVSSELSRITKELASAAGKDGRLGTADDTLTRNDIQERQRQLDALQNQSSALESSVRSTEAFSNALDRLAGDLADTVLGEAQSAEQQARRDVNRLQAELNTLPADATPSERLDATARLRDAQQRQAELSASADDIATRRRQLAGRQAFEVEQFQQRARAGNLGNDLQRQIRARDAIQERIDAGQNVASDERARLAELTASIADAFENSLAGVQLAAEADALDVWRQEVDAGFQRAQQQAEERQRSVDSGLELLQSPEQAAAQRGLDQFNDAINGSLSLVASELNSIAPNLPQLDDGIVSLRELSTLFSQFPNQIGGIREQFLANLQQARDNITGNISAQIAQFDVERSRPSRQALQAQDINTQQGRAELNRLLRGDDANRDQPILQGIKEQTAILKLIDQRINDVKTTVGVAGA